MVEYFKLTAPTAETSPASDDTAKIETPAPSAGDPMVQPAKIRLLKVGEDAFAIECLDRWYSQYRASYEALSPRATGKMCIYTPSTKLISPKAWSFRVRDSHDHERRRTATLMEVSCDCIVQMQIDRHLGIETDELEADYYRMALENGKEATLVARDISGFGLFSMDQPMGLVIFNPSHLHTIDILVRVWGEEQSTSSHGPSYG